jgi:predicted SprT family Zn-dependent metalloprotease
MRVPKRLAEQTALNTKVGRWANLWSARGLQSRVSVSFSQRMRRSLGRCVPQRGVVRLNARVLRGNPELLDEVLCHELAHIATFELHGPKVRPHGPEWGALMRAAGFEPRVRTRLNRDVQAAREAADQALYEHRCPVCHMTRLARRPVRRWRCAACSVAGLEGKLVITKRTGRRA